MFGAGLQNLLSTAVKRVKEEKKAVVFGYYVEDPERYGVADFDEKGNVLSIEEKPEDPSYNYAVVGLYYYPNSVVEIAKKVKPSSRGELEITTVNQTYLRSHELKLQKLSRGFAWLDTGTHESMSEATEFVKAVEKRTGLKIACLEEIEYRKGYIDERDLLKHVEGQGKSTYGKYLSSLL